MYLYIYVIYVYWFVFKPHMFLHLSNVALATAVRTCVDSVCLAGQPKLSSEKHIAGVFDDSESDQMAWAMAESAQMADDQTARETKELEEALALSMAEASGTVGRLALEKKEAWLL